MRIARLSGKGNYRKNQENGGRGLENNALSDSYINNTTINVKPQKAGDMTPLDYIVEGDTAKVNALKLQLETQAKLIEDLIAKVEDIEGREKMKSVGYH
jgi:hypothetical protein